MKMTKRIIIRIIVAVVVAFILSKLKLIGIMHVNALEVNTAIPYGVRPFTDWNTTQNLDIQQSQILYTFYYGNTIDFNSTKYGVSYVFNADERLNDKLWDTTFSLFSNFTSRELSPLRVYIKDDLQRISPCDVNSTRADNFQLSAGYVSYVSTVYCKNAYISSNTRFQVMVQSEFMGGNGFNGISRVQFIRSDNDSQSTLNDIKNNTQETNDKLQETNDKLQETNDYLKSDNHSDADSEASGFFNNFGGNNHGISGIVTAPLRLLQSLSTASCSPLTFSLPFVNEQVTLPCMRGIYEQYFGIFFSLWQLITTGLISYNVSLNIYSKVRAMQNPNNDKIEVLNL